MCILYTDRCRIYCNTNTKKVFKTFGLLGDTLRQFEDGVDQDQTAQTSCMISDLLCTMKRHFSPKIPFEVSIPIWAFHRSWKFYFSCIAGKVLTSYCWINGKLMAPLKVSDYSFDLIVRSRTIIIIHRFRHSTSDFLKYNCCKAQTTHLIVQSL